MASTSINIQPCKIGSSEEHNFRLKSLDYVRPELSHKNESWKSDDKTLIQHLDAVRNLVKEKTGRKLQEKATPIREGVIVIQESTTMEDLQRFAKACEEHWGIKALQIHIHRDEGYMRSKGFKTNLHAHIVFRWIVEETGKSPRLGRNQMVEMQTLLADTLGMDRGVSSDKKHLSSLQFKNEAESKRLAETQNQLQEATKDLGDVPNIRERIKEAEETPIKDIEAILEENTTKTLFGGRKTDYEAVIAKYIKQEQAKAIVKASEQTNKEQRLQARVASLNAELSQEKSIRRKTEQELESAKQGISERENRLFSIATILREGFDSKFEDFKDEAHTYFLDKLGKFLDLASAVLMWMGGAIRDSIGNKYTADRENAKMLINDKTIEQHESIECEDRTMKEKERGITTNRMRR